MCGILLSNKKEGAIDICNNVNELQSNYANLKSHREKSPYCLIHGHKMLVNANQSAMTESRTVVPGSGRVEREEMIKGLRVTHGDDGHIHYLDYGGGFMGVKPFQK